MRRRPTSEYSKPPNVTHRAQPCPARAAADVRIDLEVIRSWPSLGWDRHLVRRTRLDVRDLPQDAIEQLNMLIGLLTEALDENGAATPHLSAVSRSAMPYGTESGILHG